MIHAVFPGGARFRPELCITVANACGGGSSHLADASAVAIELLHCASLVYDDLPCFDNSTMRRGLATVHHIFGEGLALLVGSALTVLAFEALAREGREQPQLSGELLQIVAHGAGCPWGITTGQAWEAEDIVADVRAYHRSKTGALFEAAILAGAIAGGGDPAQWRGLGNHLGEAYQVADDLRDVCGSSEQLGKPVGQDETHGRPSAVAEIGVAGCIRRIGELVGEVCARVPPCVGRHEVLTLIQRCSMRLLPQSNNLHDGRSPNLIAASSAVE